MFLSGLLFGFRSSFLLLSLRLEHLVVFGFGVLFEGLWKGFGLILLDEHFRLGLFVFGGGNGTKSSFLGLLQNGLVFLLHGNDFIVQLEDVVVGKEVLDVVPVEQKESVSSSVFEKDLFLSSLTELADLSEEIRGVGLHLRNQFPNGLLFLGH